MSVFKNLYWQYGRQSILCLLTNKQEFLVEISVANLEQGKEVLQLAIDVISKHSDKQQIKSVNLFPQKDRDVYQLQFQIQKLSSSKNKQGQILEISVQKEQQQDQQQQHVVWEDVDLSESDQLSVINLYCTALYYRPQEVVQSQYLLKQLDRANRRIARRYEGPNIREEQLMNAFLRLMPAPFSQLPLLQGVEWEVDPGTSDDGMGDFLFSDQNGHLFAVAEFKGGAASKKVTHAEKRARNQAQDIVAKIVTRNPSCLVALPFWFVTQDSFYEQKWSDLLLRLSQIDYQSAEIGKDICSLQEFDDCFQIKELKKRFENELLEKRIKKRGKSDLKIECHIKLAGQVAKRGFRQVKQNFCVRKVF